MRSPGAEAGGPAGVHRLAQAVDISEGGIGLVTRLPLHEKDVIRLLIPGPEPSTSLPLRAEVVWSVPARTGTRYGLRFLSRGPGISFRAIPKDCPAAASPGADRGIS